MFSGRSMSSWLKIGLIIVGGVSVMAQAAEDCTQIDDPMARLACFDRQFSRSEPPSGTKAGENRAGENRTGEKLNVNPANQVEQAPEPVQETIRVEPQRERAGEAEVADQAGTRTQAQSVRNEEPKQQKRGWFSRFTGEKKEYYGTVIDLLNNPKQRMVFQLDNGQIWIQSQARNLPIRKGDKVSVRSATGGGFILRSADGVSARVDLLP